jgi:hypothetical protein
MRRFLRFLRRRLWPPRSDGPLLTAVIVRKDGGWTTWWADIPAFSPGGAFQTLGWLVQATEALLEESGGAFRTLDALVEAADALVRGRDPSGGGTLQYKIYPWGRPGVGDERSPFDVFMLVARGTGRGGTVPEARPHTTYQISGSLGDLQAVEIARGSNVEVHGRTADDLVSQVGEVRGGRPDGFTWIRDIRSLPHTN